MALPVAELADRLGQAGPDAPDVALGFYELWRHRLYNSVAYLTPREGRYEPVHVHRKMFLPTYGVFEEGRFVEPGRDVKAFDTRFGRMGMLICEEMWHSLPSTILALDGAELILCVSASPAREFAPGGGLPGNLQRWDQLAPASAREHGVFLVVSQLVGSEGGKVFPGGSIAVGPEGSILARGPLLEEGGDTGDPTSVRYRAGASVFAAPVRPRAGASPSGTFTPGDPGVRAGKRVRKKTAWMRHPSA